MSYPGSVKGLTVGLTVVLVSILGGLVLGEVFLRTFLPNKYLNAVAATNVADSTKIWAPPENTTNFFRHPDTKQKITLRRNNVGMRSGENVIESELKSTTNIAVFGDSFTDNIRLHEPHVFTNVLERLLNTPDKRFRVLNYGVDSYGTDQAFVRYMEQPYRGEFHHVVYVFCFNDLRNNMASGISSIDEMGKISIVPKFPRVPSFLKRVTQMHMTYFIVEMYLRVSKAVSTISTAFASAKRADGGQASAKSSPPDPSIRLFKGLLFAWKSEVERNGGQFHVVSLPGPDEHRFVNRHISRSIRLIDLQRNFAATVADYKWSKVRFANDNHWNETGNLIAAVSLYNSMAFGNSQSKLADQEITASLKAHYANAPGRWRPDGIGLFGL